MRPGAGRWTLDGQSILANQRDQVADLSERREQSEMMIRWKEGMGDLRDTAVGRILNLCRRIVDSWPAAWQ